MKLIFLKLYLFILFGFVASQSSNNTSDGGNSPQSTSDSSTNGANSGSNSSPATTGNSPQPTSDSSTNGNSNDDGSSATTSGDNSQPTSDSSDDSDSNNDDNDSNNDNNDTQSGSSNQAQGSLTLVAPQLNQYTPVMIALGSTVNFTWKYNIKPSQPVGGFSIMAIRTTPAIVTYPIATNLSANTFTYSWNTQDYNNDPNTVNTLIADNSYKLYIFDSNHTYNYAATFGQLMPFITNMAVYSDQTPSTQFNFSSSILSHDTQLILLGLLVMLSTTLF
jgi:hypothetical protein